MQSHHSLFKKLVVSVFVFLLCLNTLVVPFAADNDDEFYTHDKNDIKKLFDMDLKDIAGAIKDPLGWLSTGETFIVIREYKEKGTTKYKFYTNTPNIAQLMKNKVTTHITDGWDNNTFTPEDDILVNVGDNSNIMNKFGYKLPNNTYYGEYPNVYMTLSGILPTGFFQGLWRGIKSIFGFSFVKAPNKENFRSLRYFNHTYTNTEDEQLIDFIQKYWLKYFVNSIWSDGSEYFRDAAHFLSLQVSESAYNSAKQFVKAHEDEKNEIEEIISKHNEWEAKYSTEELMYQNDAEYKAAKDAYENYEAPEGWDYRFRTPPPGKPPKPDWEKYQRENHPEPDPPTEEQLELLSEYYKNANIMDAYESFKERWENGRKKNNKSYKSSGYKFSYAQCLIDTEGEEDEDSCTKTIDGKSTTASVTEVFVLSGIYRIGLDKESAKNSSNNNSAGGTTAQDITSSGTAVSLNAMGAAQSFAYLNGKWVVAWGDGGKESTTGTVAVHAANGSVLSSTRFSGTHGNGATVGNDGLFILAGAPAQKFGTTSSSTSNVGTMSWGYSNIGYDKETGNYVTSTHDTITVLNSKGHKIKSTSRPYKNMFASQDICAAEGLIFACRCNIGNNFIDIFDENTLQYLGSLADNRGGEIESIEVVNGELVVLFHGPDIIHKTGLMASSLGGGFAPELKYKNSLSRVEAVKILAKLQAVTGPAYEEVMTNIITCMIQNAEREGKKIKVDDRIDPRVMPYDVDTIIPSNRNLLNISDSRVNKYKELNLKGALITDRRLTTKGIFKSTLPGATIAISGFFSKCSVVLNQINSFAFLESLGFNPTELWKLWPYVTVTCLLAVMCIIGIVKTSMAYATGNGGGISKVLARIVIFILYISLVAMFTVYPNETWNSVKKVTNTCTSFGESAVLATDENLAELYGDGKDTSVTYYIPYFNIWSVYNTGYSVMADEQKIDKSKPEAEGMSDIPKINNEDTTLWCVVLADSFNTRGSNRNNLDGSGINNGLVNNNAYRVVDHFLAPRLTTSSPSNGNLNITNKANENDNGHFQNINVFTLLGNIVLCFNLFILVLLKTLTLIWFYYLLYTMIFNIVLQSTKHGGLKSTIITTFTPLLYVMVIGASAGILIKVSMLTDGLFNFLINIGMTFLIKLVLKSWGTMQSCPASVKPICILLNLRYFLQQRQIRMLGYDIRHEEWKTNQHGNEDEYINEEGEFIGDESTQRNLYNMKLEQARLEYINARQQGRNPEINEGFRRKAEREGWYTGESFDNITPTTKKAPKIKENKLKRTTDTKIKQGKTLGKKRRFKINGGSK